MSVMSTIARPALLVRVAKRPDNATSMDICPMMTVTMILITKVHDEEGKKILCKVISAGVEQSPVKAIFCRNYYCI